MEKYFKYDLEPKPNIACPKCFKIHNGTCNEDLPKLGGIAYR